MTESRSTPENPSLLADDSAWWCHALSAEVRCAPAVLENVRAVAVDGLKKLGRGGIETGGILFGLRTSDSIRILAARPLECEHRFGPSFVLSDNDEAGLRRMLEPANRDEETRPLEPLGLYIAHTRRGFNLTENDIVLLERYFPNPGTTNIVIAPEKSGAAKVGFFVRGTGGALESQTPSHEIALPSPVQAVIAAAASAAVVATRPEPVVPHVPSQIETAAPREVAFNRLQTFLREQESQRRVTRWNLWATVAILVLCVAGGGYMAYRSYTKRPAATLPLRVSDSGSQLRIDWDSNLEAVKTAVAGVLEMREADGSSVRVRVPPDALRTGSAIYNRRSDKVEVRLQLLYADKPALESVIYFINPSNSPPEQVAKNAVTEPVKPVAPTSAATNTADRQDPHTLKAPRNFEPPAPLAQESQTSTPTALGPATLSSPIEPHVPHPPALALTLPSGVPPPPAPAPAAAPIVKPAEPLRPRFGRLIWTGDLARNALLTLSGAGASLGWVNGKLPGFPVNVSVHPAELVAGGIEIYTRDPKRASSAEPPSAQNGWSTVVYKYDPKRTTDIRVVEVPSASNSWSQVVLQNGRHNVSVIVLDWQRAPSQ